MGRGTQEWRRGEFTAGIGCAHGNESVAAHRHAADGPLERRRRDSASRQQAIVAIVAVPHRDLLTSPKDGARLRKAPRLTWRADAEADYYNAQLLLDGVKILSVWPTRPAFALHKTRKFCSSSFV